MRFPQLDNSQEFYNYLVANNDDEKFITRKLDCHDSMAVIMIYNNLAHLCFLEKALVKEFPDYIYMCQ